MGGVVADVFWMQELSEAVDDSEDTIDRNMGRGGGGGGEEERTEVADVFWMQELSEAVDELESTPSLGELEKLLGYKFNNQSLLQEAMIHRSVYYPDKVGVSYERLEFIGDSVLNLLVASEVYFSYPEFSSGQLTRLRATNVDTEKLARVAVKHGLHRFFVHKNPEFDKKARRFKKEIMDYPLHSYGLVRTPKFLANIVESTIGAVFIDSKGSLDIVWEVFRGLLEPIIDPETMGTHPVTQLIEYCHKRSLEVRFEKSSSKKNTTIDVFVNDQLVGSATSRLRKGITQNWAAKAALDHLVGTLLAEDNCLVDAKNKSDKKND